MIRRGKFSKFLGAIGIGAVLALAGFGGPADAGENGPTVVELYTSQGCSSCPPADAFLGDLAQRDDVIALSFHVDYWDYIGWKDPFASASNSNRQRSYARQFNRSYVYTPQMVIQGVTEVSGSDKSGVLKRVKQVASMPDVPVKLTLVRNGGLKVEISGARQPAQASVWLVLYDNVHKTKVKRGENRGRVIKNYNVVKGLVKIGDWRGEPVTLTVSADDVRRHNSDKCAVFLQSEHAGPIFGASSIPLVAQR